LIPAVSHVTGERIINLILFLSRGICSPAPDASARLSKPGAGSKLHGDSTYFSTWVCPKIGHIDSMVSKIWFPIEKVLG
jgi:hypothetical protein